jgi:hypothetical protein
MDCKLIPPRGPPQQREIVSCKMKNGLITMESYGIQLNHSLKNADQFSSYKL